MALTISDPKTLFAGSIDKVHELVHFDWTEK